MTLRWSEARTQRRDLYGAWWEAQATLWAVVKEGSGQRQRLHQLQRMRSSPGDKKDQ